MRSILRHTIVIRIVCGLFALYYFNISINIEDSTSIGQELSVIYNEQESIIELICETVFGQDDAFLEYDDLDSDKQQVKKIQSFEINFISNFFYIHCEPLRIVVDQEHHFKYGGALIALYPSKFSPPPQII